MPKQLSEMSLEKSRELFPIVLQEHQEVWKRWYEEERKRLQQLLLRDEMKRISHIALKLQLWKRYEYNRDAYTENKTEFIKRDTKKAKEEFYCRYE